MARRDAPAVSKWQLVKARARRQRSSGEAWMASQLCCSEAKASTKHARGSASSDAASCVADRGVVAAAQSAPAADDGAADAEDAA
eukprot:scaffold6073_cov175-Prasinococcus_capsulatus_cf.AAC.1